MVKRASYPTDVTDEQWCRLEPLIPAPKPGGRPPDYTRREIVNAVFYQLRGGAAWRLLPHDLPPWGITYHYWRAWRKDGTWERVHDALRSEVRRAVGKEAQPSAAIVDSQSVKTTDRGGVHGYDAGKKVNGRKRHVLVDTLGLVCLVVVTAASTQDRDGARILLEVLATRMRRLRLIWDRRRPRNASPLPCGWLRRPPVFGRSCLASGGRDWQEHVNAENIRRQLRLHSLSDAAQTGSRPDSPVGLEQFSRSTLRGRFEVRHECRDAVEYALQSIPLEFGCDVRIGYDIEQRFCLSLIQPFGTLRRSGEGQHLAVLGEKLPAFRNLFSARSRFDFGFDVIAQPHQQESGAAVDGLRANHSAACGSPVIRAVQRGIQQSGCESFHYDAGKPRQAGPVTQNVPSDLFRYRELAATREQHEEHPVGRPRCAPGCPTRRRPPGGPGMCGAHPTPRTAGPAPL